LTEQPHDITPTPSVKLQSDELRRARRVARASEEVAQLERDLAEARRLLDEAIAELVG
jgi:hypothetical protein